MEDCIERYKLRIIDTVRASGDQSPMQSMGRVADVKMANPEA